MKFEFKSAPKDFFFCFFQILAINLRFIITLKDFLVDAKPLSFTDFKIKCRRRLCTFTDFNFYKIKPIILIHTIVFILQTQIIPETSEITKSLKSLSEQ